ncbi:hypothetical protein LOY37_14045 [Pseudomonas sp. B21-012]|uniref:hypothetical protein n=1 Tax=Pseudomonas sp. B21-012 TaxID=2895472 RepID=UPI00215EBFE9|nr:hypothetical protein [Pseudomonas sp. B21-012]UVM53500.1 hypothetical protein LOY37_14045 [Pseudomonas sp. B21-012]
MQQLMLMFNGALTPRVSRSIRMQGFRGLRRHAKATNSPHSADVAFVLKHLLKVRWIKLLARRHATAVMTNGRQSQEGNAGYQALFDLVENVHAYAGTSSGMTLLEIIYF